MRALTPRRWHRDDRDPHRRGRDGKIAVNQHVPAITANPHFDLVATVGRSAPASTINYTGHAAM